MNKPLLTIGILLSLGTIGCAGVGVQPSSSLTAQFQNRTAQGLDELWDEAAEPPRLGLESPQLRRGAWRPLDGDTGADPLGRGSREDPARVSRGPLEPELGHPTLGDRRLTQLTRLPQTDCSSATTDERGDCGRKSTAQ